MARIDLIIDIIKKLKSIKSDKINASKVSDKIPSPEEIVKNLKKLLERSLDNLYNFIQKWQFLVV